MAATELSTTLTDFLQHSGRVLTDVEQGEIILRRREGDDLVLLTRRNWEALTDSFLALDEAHRLAQDKAGNPGEPTRFALPWMSLLTPEDQRACIEEVRRATIAALHSGKLSDLATLLAQWRGTALATWDDASKQNRPEYRLDDPRPLCRP